MIGVLEGCGEKGKKKTVTHIAVPEPRSFRHLEESDHRYPGTCEAPEGWPYHSRRHC